MQHGEDGLASETLEGRLTHLLRVGEAHVLGDQRDSVLDDLTWKTKPRQDVARHRGADLVVPVEADTVRDGESDRLADVVKQSGEGEFEPRRMELLQQEQGMDPDVALGVKVGRLLRRL